MDHIFTPAMAGGQVTCTHGERSSPALPGMGAIKNQAYFHPVYRRDLEKALKELRKDLGHSKSEHDILVSLMSFLPCYDRGRERPIGPDLLLTIFASNAALCDRAGGMDDRTLRRCIKRLEKDGWVIRRDSANGKRFARKSKGKPVAAFGIDISPLLQRSDDLVQRAIRKVELEEEKRGYIAEARALIVECEKRSDHPARLDFKSLRTTLRRVTMTLHHVKETVRMLKEHLTGSACEEPKTDQEAKNITTERACSISDQIDHDQDAPFYRGDLKHLGSTHHIPEKTECTSKTGKKTVQNRDDQSINKTSSHASCSAVHGQKTADMTATDGQNVRHTETQKSEFKNMTVPIPDEPSSTWDTCSEIKAFFPVRPRSSHDIMQLLFDAGRLLRIGDALISEAVQKLPLSACMTILDSMMQQAARIVSPDSYFKSMISGRFKS